MDKKQPLLTLLPTGISFAVALLYPKAFIEWNIPFYFACIAALIICAFLFFFSLFTARMNKKPLVPSLIGTAVYSAILLSVTPLVNNGIFGSVAPWGSVLVNTILNFSFHITMLILINKATSKKIARPVTVSAFLLFVGLIMSILFTVPNIKATSFVILDTTANYEKRIEKIEVFNNTLEDALPQTAVYDIIKEHLEAPLADGKTEKKVLVLGWDGARADIFEQFYGNEIAERLINAGGKVSLAYCGGTNFPEKITQDTSTAPGWCTMLTGVWGDKHGINGNGTEKSEAYPTLLTSAVESGTIDKSAFYFSWDGHLTTYKNEIDYVKQNNLNVTFGYSEKGDGENESDNGTFNKALGDIKSPDCSDFIFTIFEYCDALGHEYGFWNDTPEYQEAVKLSAQKGNELIDAVESRSTYENEDWLIIITSDHGGYVRGHGGETIMERMMFIATNK